MCGRYTLTSDLKNLAKRFAAPTSASLQKYTRRYNVAPTQDIITISAEDKRQIVVMKWGLIPSWAKDPTIGNRIINARAETLLAKPAFRVALRKRRCLIPADGFYEWHKRSGSKQPLRIVLRSQETFAFAGLWDTWTSSHGEVIQSCTIITTESNEIMKTVHDRMPVILQRDQEELWLDSKITNPSDTLPLLKSYPSSLMKLYHVSKMVNSPAHDTPDCIRLVSHGTGGDPTSLALKFEDFT